MPDKGMARMRLGLVRLGVLCRQTERYMEIIAPVIKYTKSTHSQEAPFLSCGHPSPKGGRTKCTVAHALAPYGGKWRFSAERGLNKTVTGNSTV